MPRKRNVIKFNIIGILLFAVITCAAASPQAQSAFFNRGQSGIAISADINDHTDHHNTGLGATWNGSIYGILDVGIGYLRIGDTTSVVNLEASIFILKPATISRKLQISLDIAYRTIKNDNSRGPRYAIVNGISAYLSYNIGWNSFLQPSASLGYICPTTDWGSDVSYYGGEITLGTHLGKYTLLALTPSVTTTDGELSYGISIGLALIMNNKSKRHAIPTD